MSNPLIEQFIIESRDYLQRIGEILIALEEKGEDKDLLNELFRIVHTLKGNSGLFDFLHDKAFTLFRGFNESCKGMHNSLQF
jgi:chemotaxis protein histidine kinase CheA